MRSGRHHGRRDNWGRPPKDPFLRLLYDDPERIAKLSRAVTIGLILFWTSFVLGMLIIVYLMIFG
jgi:hypothetical protein